MTLASKGYAANDADVTHIAEAVIAAVNTATEGRQNYLRAMTAETQKALGASPRLRTAKSSIIPAETVTAHLAALNATHERFYAIVLEVAGKHIPPATKDRAQELNRRTNFARTALYSLRTWIKAKNDITTLAPARVTKASLIVANRRLTRPPTPAKIKTRMERLSKKLMVEVLALVDADRGAAVAELELLAGQLAGQIAEITQTRATRDIRQAAKDHKPVRYGDTMFIPLTRTQAALQQARPS